MENDFHQEFQKCMDNVLNFLTKRLDDGFSRDQALSKFQECIWWSFKAKEEDEFKKKGGSPIVRP